MIYSINAFYTFLFGILQDKANKDALPVIHLIDVLKPGTIDYGVVKQGGNLQ